MHTRTLRLTLPVAALVLASGVAACGSSSNNTSAGAPTAQATPAAQATPETPAALDAKAVLDKLTVANVGLTNGAVQDENTDPNNLLGRPNGYTSRASADLPGGDTSADKYDSTRGLVIEVYADKEGADARSKYIQDALKNMPMLGTEWHYRADGGKVLVRVSGNVKPSLAKKIEQVVTGL